MWDQARLPDGGIAKHRASEEPATARVIFEAPHSRVVLGDAPRNEAPSSRRGRRVLFCRENPN